MALPKRYIQSGCSLARALEIVGERWTLLIVRDAFYGVRRFGDFVEHLGVPRAVLSDRLRELVEHGVLTKTPVPGRGHCEYELTPMGLELWPIVYGLIRWGDDHLTPGDAPRVFEHAEDGGRLAADSTCEVCGRTIGVEEINAVPGPGANALTIKGAVGNALLTPHRLLEPVTSP
jgi:DNA-binding HxlR family transcriptional regulator